ncbi:hypothetical protein ID866_2072 [Astraeus odoratus]|nr:hypothetical protein ID866_2072 [Astraeus odoratus]
MASLMLPPFPVTSAMKEHFCKNYKQHLLANDLQVRAKKMMACFPKSILPLPCEDLSAAWNELPNNTIDIMPMSFKSDMIFLRAPPPTPVNATFPIEVPRPKNSLVDSRSDDRGSLLIYTTDPMAPDVVAFEGLDLNIPGCLDLPTESADPSLQHGDGEKPWNAGIPADRSQNSDNSISSMSDSDSTTSSPRSSPPFQIQFHEVVENSIAEIRARGIEPFVDSLLISGIESIQAAAPASMVAHAVIREILKESYTESRDLTKAIRVGAMAMFRQHWKLDGNWVEISSTSGNHSSATLRGVNKAGLMGSLFTARVATADDVFLCLALLLEGQTHFDRLCAMHALLVQANDKLCKSRNFSALKAFETQLTVADPVSGQYAWAPSSHAQAILEDILDTIAGWMDAQAIKRSMDIWLHLQQ